MMLAGGKKKQWLLLIEIEALAKQDFPSTVLPLNRRAIEKTPAVISDGLLVETGSPEDD
jgi:hypothetical protein